MIHFQVVPKTVVQKYLVVWLGPLFFLFWAASVNLCWSLLKAMHELEAQCLEHKKKTQHSGKKQKTCFRCWIFNKSMTSVHFLFLEHWQRSSTSRAYIRSDMSASSQDQLRHSFGFRSFGCSAHNVELVDRTTLRVTGSLITFKFHLSRSWLFCMRGVVSCFRNLRKQNVWERPACWVMFLPLATLNDPTPILCSVSTAFGFSQIIPLPTQRLRLPLDHFGPTPRAFWPATKSHRPRGPHISPVKVANLEVTGGWIQWNKKRAFGDDKLGGVAPCKTTGLRPICTHLFSSDFKVTETRKTTLYIQYMKIGIDSAQRPNGPKHPGFGRGLHCFQGRSFSFLQESGLGRRVVTSDSRIININRCRVSYTLWQCIFEYVYKK